MSLINIVGTSNASSVRVDNRLKTYPLAAAFVSSEKEESYTWVLQESRNAIWRDDDTLPSVFVTDNEQALRNAIESVFPESNHLFCTWHLWNTMATKLAVGNTTKEEYNLRLAEAELAFKSAMTCSEESAFQRSLIKFQTIISAPGRFAKNGETAKLYLKNVLLQDDEVKRWAGVHANKHSHMGNRTSGRAEGYHAGLKKALGHQSASRLTLTTKRMDAYYNQKRAERNRRLRIDSLSYDSLLFNKRREYHFVNLRHKVVRFAMDRIILNTIKTTQEGFENKGEGCSCSDRIVYKLPCPCIIDSTSDIIPLTIVDKRWYIELEHGYSLSNRAFTVQRKITEKIINSDVDDTANFSGNSFKSISLDDNADEINEVEEDVEEEVEEQKEVEVEEVEVEEEEEEVKKDMMSMVKYLVRHESQFHACVATTSEASFMEKYLMPAIRRVLPQDAGKEILYAIIDKPNQDGKKPDFMIGTKVKSKELYFFFIEVKRPDTTSKYQPEDDHTKLMKQMKGSVDGQLCLGVQNPSSLGLLVEGIDCTLFQMMLHADGIYMPVAINRFSLVEKSHHFVHLPSIVEAFYFVKCELNNFVVKINEKKTNEEKRIGRERVRFSFET